MRADDETTPRRRGRASVVIAVGALALGLVAVAAGVIGAVVALGATESTAGHPTTFVTTAAPDQSAAGDSAAVNDGGRDGSVSPAAGTLAVPDPAWIAATATATGIPPRALLAYANAELIAGRSHAGCGIGWNTIAALGFVESAHGGINGSVIGADGVVSPAIIGPSLDGGQFDAIPDTDGGLLDGDPVWGRAVGPLQFIPSSWTEWGTDANGDGVADPQNIDDAALTAANYLCALSGDVTEPQNWIDSVWAYNGVESYVRSVSETATFYAERAER